MTHFEIICIAVVSVVASARVARLIGFDSYPPMVWLRIKWDNLTGDSPWNKLVHCGYCSTPYIFGANIAWGYFTDFQKAWWFLNVLLAGAYAAAYVVAYDGDD